MKYQIVCVFLSPGADAAAGERAAVGKRSASCSGAALRACGGGGAGRESPEETPGRAQENNRVSGKHPTGAPGLTVNPKPGGQHGPVSPCW